MKLYATVTSERATKGQGGEYLDIDIYTTTKETPTHRISVREVPGEITITMFRKHFGRWYNSADVDTIYTNIESEKGKKQKTA